MLKALIAPAALVFLCSCGIESKNERTSTDLSYEFNLNGCTTGKKTFEDRKNYCDTLLDEKANQGCAQNSRHEMYKNSCVQYGTLEQRLASQASPFPGIRN